MLVENHTPSGLCLEVKSSLFLIVVHSNSRNIVIDTGKGYTDASVLIAGGSLQEAFTHAQQSLQIITTTKRLGFASKKTIVYNIQKKDFVETESKQVKKFSTTCCGTEISFAVCIYLRACYS